MTPHQLDFSQWESQDSISFISPPQQFDGGEEAYDLSIGGANRTDVLQCGHGAWRLLARHAARPIDTILEIGAGGGTCSLGLIDAGREARVVVTDTSPQFLRIVQRKVEIAGLPAARVHYATLAGEHLSRLPTGSVDGIVIASALHHVGDWRGFLRDAATLLRPGGVLAIQEPFREGNLTMAMALDIALSPLWPASSAFSPEDFTKIEACRNSIYFLANSHIEKEGEDKHNFLATSLAGAAADAGFERSYLFSNVHFADLPDGDLAAHEGVCSIVRYLESFMRQHHRVSPDGMEKLSAHLFPLMRQMDETYCRGDGPPLFGCMAFRR